MLYCNKIPGQNQEKKIIKLLFFGENTGLYKQKNKGCKPLILLENLKSATFNSDGECGIRTHVPSKGQLHFECSSL